MFLHMFTILNSAHVAFTDIEGISVPVTDTKLHNLFCYNVFTLKKSAIDRRLVLPLYPPID